MQTHQVGVVRATEGGVVEVFWQGGRHTGVGDTLGQSAGLRRVLFVSCSTVLKPNLIKMENIAYDLFFIINC